ncbi:MAG: DUF167 family protein [Gammaproteobacteria bacterium]
MLNIRVQPHAPSDGFAEILGECIKLRITASPIDGKANRHLIAVIASTFKVAESDVRILSGTLERNKFIKIHQPAQLLQIIVKPL